MIDRMGRNAMRCAFDDRGPLRAATVSGELLQMPAIGGFTATTGGCNGKERCFVQKQPNCQVRFVRSAGQMIRGSKGEMDGGSLGRPVFKYLPVGEERRAFALTEVSKVGFPKWCLTVRMTSDGSHRRMKTAGMKPHLQVYRLGPIVPSICLAHTTRQHR